MKAELQKRIENGEIEAFKNGIQFLVKFGDFTKEEKEIIRQKNFIVNVSDLDIVNDKVMGFYTHELDGHLFTITDIREKNLILA